MKTTIRTTLLLLSVLPAAVPVLRADQKDDFNLDRNTEIVVNMMRALSDEYVDDVSADDLMKSAAAGMVSTLDPYTEYLPEEKMSDFEVLTTGKYGGIGSLIRKRGDWIVIAQPYEGSPADRAGLKIGDRILAVDGKSAKGWTTAQVSDALKGKPGTNVKVRIRRLADDSEQNVVIRRERIAIPGVPYYGYAAEGIGYIQHSDFTEGCFDEMRSAIEALQREGDLRGLILDYRSNGGGILQEAVKILSLFVPKGTEAVSMKGRSADDERNNRSYVTALEPLLPSTPLVVLINPNTASSAEIVAGALQDLDRAVVIGQKSFGKGLVQSTRPLGYNAFLKVTTARYHTPSGRCIQAVDYSAHDSRTGSEVPDSLIREFRTAAGRKVYDGGGIMPDIRTEPEYISRFAITLYAMGFIDDFGDEYIRRHPESPADLRSFSITDGDYDDFVAFMADKDVPYESDTRRVLRTFESALSSDLYEEQFKEYINHIKSELKDDTASNLQTYRREIIETINADIITRYGYSRSVTEHNLQDDGDVILATEVLRDAERYSTILSSQDTERK